MTTINWSQIATQAASVLIPLILTAIAAVVGNEVRKLIAKVTPVAVNFWQTKVSLSERTLLENIFRTAVTMAEQAWSRADVQEAFKLKRNLAYQFASQELQRVGIDLSGMQIEAWIEHAVHEAFNYDKTYPTLPAGPVQAVNVTNSVPGYTPPPPVSFTPPATSPVEPPQAEEVPPTKQ